MRRLMEEIDEAAKAWDAYQKFVMGIVGITVLIGGVILLIKPTWIPDFPYRQLAAIGAAIFGLLWTLAIFAGQSGAGKRSKCLLVSLALGLLAAGMFYAVVPDAIASWQLSKDGEPTTATVTGRRRARFRDQSIPMSRISYAGHTKEIRLAANKGDQIPVLFLRNQPHVVSKGSAGDSFIQLIQKRNGAGILMIGFMALVGLMFAGGSLLYLKAVFVGPSDDMVE